MKRHGAGRARGEEHARDPEKERVRAKKAFGQHFLTDPHILDKIVRAADISPGDAVLEIGPGLGHLTRALLRAGARVLAVEIDRELAERLREEAGHEPNLTVVEGDFLTEPPEAWFEKGGIPAATYKVVANIPYYITSAILRHLLEARVPPQLIVVLVQREVARQIVARPGDMSVLAVSVQFYGDPSIVGVVPAGAFNPRPKVDSAIVRIDVTPRTRFPDIDPAHLFRVVRAGFSVRRKQLRNALSGGLGLTPAEVERGLSRAGIDARRRAETLSLDEWRRVAVEFE